MGIVRLAVGSLARASGLDEERVDDIRIAVSEACTNAVFTNEETGGDEPVSVSWVRQADRIEIEIGDRNESAADQPDALDSQGFSSRLVMSVALLEELADELEVGRRPGGGTAVRLVFHTPEDGASD